MRVKALLFFLGTVLLLGIAVQPAEAADVRTGERVVIATGEVIDDDLIVSAQFIEINGMVTGDLVATGTVIIINGTVEGSALMLGQSLEVRGRVGGSIYGAAYSLLLDEGAAVYRNVLFGGFSAATRPDSQIDRDLYVAGYQLLHDGVVVGNVHVDTSALEINGTVDGDVIGEVTAKGSAAPPQLSLPNMPANIEVLPSGLVVGPTAQIGGQMLAQETAAESGQVADKGFLGMPRWLSERLGTYIGLLLTSAIVIALFPKALPHLSDVLRRRAPAVLGWGVLIYALVFPAAIVFGLILIVALTVLFALVSLGQLTSAVLGVTAGFFLFALFAFLFFVYVVGWIVVGHFLGTLLLRRSSRGAQFASVALGAFVLQALRAVPVLGFVVAFVVGTLALGAAFVSALERRHPVKAAAGA